MTSTATANLRWKKWDQVHLERLTEAGIVRAAENLEVVDGEIVRSDTQEPRLWSLEEYNGIIDPGLFGSEERSELVVGEIIEKMTPKPPHTVAVSLTGDVLSNIFGSPYVRQEAALLLASTGSEPEPDLAVVSQHRDTYTTHLTLARLVVEIAESSPVYNRGEKAGLYAAAGIADYWIVNLIDRRLEVHRDPIGDNGYPHGHRYQDVQAISESDSVSPPAAPSSTITVADLLP